MTYIGQTNQPQNASLKIAYLKGEPVTDLLFIAVDERSEVAGQSEHEALCAKRPGKHFKLNSIYICVYKREYIAACQESGVSSKPPE